MQIGEHLDQRIDAVTDRRLVAELLEFVGLANHPARHVLDHLERRTQHRVVVAHRDSTGHRNRGVVQRGHHPVFARHIVRRRGQPVQWGPSQHPLRRVVVHQEGEVGPAARDELAAQLAGAGDTDGTQVTVQGVEVKPVQRSESPDLSTTAGFAAADPIRARSR